MGIMVLVVDDSFFYRRVLTSALGSIAGVEVLGSVGSGVHALHKVREHGPDLITLDLEMPGMSGLEVLEALRQSGATAKVLVISSVTATGGELTVQALQN